MRKIKQLTQYLECLNPYTPGDALQLMALLKIAEIGGINRIQAKSQLIHTEDKTVTANMYVLNFMSSGMGKDKGLEDIENNLVTDIRESFEERAELYMERHNRLIEEEAAKKYPGSKAEAGRYIAANSARGLAQEFSNATLEGFISLREAYSSAKFGATFVRISEFADFITSQNTARGEFLSALTDVFDHGNNQPKIIKGERVSKAVRGVPSNAVLNTSTSGILDKGLANGKLMDFLNRGIARRSFICYPDARSIMTGTDEELYDQKLKGVQEADRLAPIVRQYFLELYNQTYEKQVIYYHNNVFTFTPEAERAIGIYEIRNKRKSFEIDENSDEEGVKSELSNRFWKALKLATIIAAFEHPVEKVVTLDDVQDAIEVCELHGNHLLRFYRAKPTSDTRKLYSYLKENQGKWITKTDIYEQRFVHKNATAQWFLEKLPMAEDMLEQEGYLLEEEKHGRSGKKYRVVKMTQKEEGKKEIQVSIAKTNSHTETLFKTGMIEFEKLHTITGRDGAWCSTTFSEGKRSDANATGEFDVLVFDIDGGMDMKEVINDLKDRQIKSLIATTRSHQKEKSGKPACDRFRIVLPLASRTVLSKEEYKSKVRAVAKAFGFNNDPSTINPSRLWFGNPEQEFHYTEGGSINIDAFQEEVIEKRESTGHSSTGDDSGIKKWFAANWEKYGGCNNTLYIAKQFFKNDKGYEREKVRENVLEINSMWDDPLPLKRIELTVFKSL